MMFAGVETQLPLWTQLIDTFGVSVLLVMFGLLVFWRLMPYIVDWFKASIAQANIVSTAVPRIEKNLDTIAEGSKHIEVVAAAASRNEKKADAVLQGNERLENATREILDAVRRKA